MTFAVSSGIDDALIMLRPAGIDIQGVLDARQGDHDWAATHWLHDEGIEVVLSDKNKLPGLGKLHHKLMVIDDDIVVAGSMNYTAPANEYNDEKIAFWEIPMIFLKTRVVLLIAWNVRLLPRSSGTKSNGLS